MKSWKTERAGSGASLSDIRNSRKTLAGKSDKKRPIGRIIKYSPPEVVATVNSYCAMKVSIVMHLYINYINLCLYSNPQYY
jgi:hypothetical protein